MATTELSGDIDTFFGYFGRLHGFLDGLPALMDQAAVTEAYGPNRFASDMALMSACSAIEALARIPYCAVASSRERFVSALRDHTDQAEWGRVSLVKLAHAISRPASVDDARLRNAIEAIAKKPEWQTNPVGRVWPVASPDQVIRLSHIVAASAVDRDLDATRQVLATAGIREGLNPYSCFPDY